MSAVIPHDANLQPTMHLQRGTPDGRTKRVWCIAPFPDNKRVVSASDDDFVVVWKFRTNEEEYCWSHKGATTVAVSPDGTKVVSGGRDGDLHIWDADSGAHLSGPWMQHTDRVWSVGWSPDGNRIASCSADGILIIWNAHPSSPSGEVICGHLQTGHGVVRAIAYFPQGGKVATSGNNPMVKIWDDNTGGLQRELNNETETVPSVAWTKDGGSVISGSIDGTVRVWNILEQDPVHKMSAHEDAVNYIAVSDHVFATASTDHIISLWDLKTYGLVGSLACEFSSPEAPGNHDEVRCIAFTADENTIVAGTERGVVYTFDIGEIISRVDMKAVSPTNYDLQCIHVLGRILAIVVCSPPTFPTL